MRNVLQILRRDLKRLVTVPAAWVIMIGIIIIPPLYAWFNIYGFSYDHCFGRDRTGFSGQRRRTVQRA